jgi:hypothetical protein
VLKKIFKDSVLSLLNFELARAVLFVSSSPTKKLTNIRQGEEIYAEKFYEWYQKDENIRESHHENLFNENLGHACPRRTALKKVFKAALTNKSPQTSCGISWVHILIGIPAGIL